MTPSSSRLMKISRASTVFLLVANIIAATMTRRRRGGGGVLQLSLSWLCGVSVGGRIFYFILFCE